MVYLVLGLYPLFYGLGTYLTVSYMKRYISIEDPSVGRYIGGQLLLQLVGVATGLAISLVVGRVWTIWLLIAGVFYIALMVQNLQIIRGYVTKATNKKIGVDEINKVELSSRKYKLSQVQVLVGVIVAFALGLLLPPVFSLVGYILIGLSAIQYERVVSPIVADAKDMTPQERIKKQKRFDEANNLHEIDNQQGYLKLKRRVRKMFNINKGG